MTTPEKLVSIVVPVYNEEANIDGFYDAVCRVTEGLSGRYAFEFVFTDNCSTDATFEKLSRLHERDARVRVFRFSRNFGYQRSIMTGYLKARGDAVVQLDCDLQDPPGMLVEFLARWEEGYKVVYGVRRSRREGALIGLARKAFYRLIRLMSETELPLDAGDFRLVDRQVVNVLAATNDARPYLRGAIAAAGFRQTGIPYDRRERLHGESKFPLRSLLGLALDGIVNHSSIPLRLASFIGLLCSLVTLVATAGYLVGRLFFGMDWPAGFATTIIVLLFGISLNALFLGIIGEYLARILEQVRPAPLTIIEATLDHPQDGAGRP